MWARSPRSGAAVAVAMAFIATAVRGLEADGSSAEGEREVLLRIGNSWGGLWDQSLQVCSSRGIICNDEGMVRSVALSYNRLSGTLPPELSALKHLTELALSNNRLSGTLPPELGAMTQLTVLDLSHNYLSGTLPPELGAMTQLTRWDLRNNYLSGTLPPELGAMTQLTRWDLSLNELSGTLPPELGAMTQLTELDLSYNELSGTLPPELSALKQLTELDLSFNRLSGTLPPELGAMTQLTRWYLSYNELSGTLPPELGAMTQLIWWDLRYNQLSGTVPREILEPITDSTSVPARTLYAYDRLRLRGNGQLRAVVSEWDPEFEGCDAALPADALFYFAIVRVDFELSASLLCSPTLVAWWAGPLALSTVAVACVLGGKLMVKSKQAAHPCQHLRRVLRCQVPDLILLVVVLVLMTFNFASVAGMGIRMNVWFLSTSLWQELIPTRPFLNTAAVLVFNLCWWVAMGVASRASVVDKVNWAPAASREVFRESTAVVRREQRQLLAFSAAITVLLAASSSQIEIFDQQSPDYRLAPSLMSSWLGLCFYFMMLSILRPVELRHRAMIRGLNTSSHTWLQWTARAWGAALIQLALLLVATVFVLSVFDPLALFSDEKFYYDLRPVLVRGPLFLLVGGLLLGLLCMSGCDCRRFCTRQASHSEPSPLAGRGHSRATHEDTTARRLFARLFGVDEGSVVRTRRLLLVATLWWQALPQATVAVIAVTWAATIVTVAALLLVHDREATFHDILDSPSFGLVVDARDLEAALAATLSKLAGKAAEPHTGPLRKYTATMFRMQRAVAISYRWQPEKVTVAECPAGGAPTVINMSKWQMEQLLKHLRGSWVDYVWLDCLSVVQPPLDEAMQQLQRTLLARMMAVYVAAHHTLVLRSREAELGRYHQRAWTCQEYCCARRLVVVTEKARERERQLAGHVEEGSAQHLSGGPTSAVLDEELERIDSLRRRVQLGMRTSQPVWLLARAHSPNAVLPVAMPVDAGDSAGEPHALCELSAQEMSERATLYAELAPQVHCMDKVDRVRALAPMLFNSPVAGHEELVHLMELVESATQGSIPAVCEAVQALRAVGRPQDDDRDDGEGALNGVREDDDPRADEGRSSRGYAEPVHVVRSPTTNGWPDGAPVELPVLT